MVDLNFQHSQSTLPNGSMVVITKIHGAVDATTVRHFEEEIKGFLERNCRHLILDFGELKYINSTGMGMMVSLTDRFADMEGSIQLCNIPKKIGDLFDMLGLLSIFQVFEKAEDAIAALTATHVPPAPLAAAATAASAASAASMVAASSSLSAISSSPSTQTTPFEFAAVRDALGADAMPGFMSNLPNLPSRPSSRPSSACDRSVWLQ